MLQQRFLKWLHQRFQYKGINVLKQKEVLVFLYQQGYLYLVLILITFIAGVNYANNLILAFCFLISAILCISFYITFKQLYALKIEVVFPEVGRVNEVFTLKLILHTPDQAIKFLNLKVDDQFQHVAVHSQQQIEFNFQPQQRGQFKLPTIQIFSTYPLGLVRAWTYIYMSEPIWIAPEPYKSENELFSSRSSGMPDWDEFYELNQYRQGDSLSAVSWKQAARGQGLYIKRFEDHVEQETMQIDYHRMPADEHEVKLSLMMALVDECEQQQRVYQVTLPHVDIEQGVGFTHYQMVKIKLAQA